MFVNFLFPCKSKHLLSSDYIYYIDVCFKRTSVHQYPKGKKNLKLKTKFQRLVKCQIENSSYYCSRTYTFQSSKNIFARMWSGLATVTSIWDVIQVKSLFAWSENKINNLLFLSHICKNKRKKQCYKIYIEYQTLALGCK